MKVLGNHDNLPHRNKMLAQVGVESLAQYSFWQASTIAFTIASTIALIIAFIVRATRVAREVEVYMRALGERVHASICPTGAVEVCFLSAETENRFFYRPLHAYADALALPADEGFAIVFEG